MFGQSLKFVALQLHLSLFIYGGVLFFLAQNNPDWQMTWQIKESFLLLFFALTLLSLSTASLSILWPLFFGKKEEPLQSLQSSSSKLFFDFEKKEATIQSQTILRMALAESVAVFGLVLAFLNQTPLLFIPYGIVSLTLQVLVGPFRRNVFGF